MTISIIVPVYKVENYIRQCLESILEQVSNDFFIECILVDDCSPDKSMEIAKDVVDNCKNLNISFNLLHHKVNKGVSAARNTGISASTGDFLFFVDSDDEIPENTLKYLFSYLIDCSYVDVVMGNTLWMEQQFLSNTPLTNNKNSPYMIDDKNVIWKLVLRRQIDRLVVNKLIRRSIIIDNEIFFDKDVALYEDVIWTYRLYMHISSILIVPAMTYTYVNNPMSLTHTTKQRAIQLVDSLTIVSDYVYSHPPVVNGKEIHYAAHRLFSYRWLLMALDVKEKQHLKSKSDSKLASLRDKMFLDAVKHVRPFMVLFLMTMYPPLKYLLKSHVYRSNLYRLDMLAYKFS